MKIKWNKKLKERFGYSQAKDIFISHDKDCFEKKCFRPHDWNHDGHLVCLTNARFGCPLEEIRKVIK